MESDAKWLLENTSTIVETIVENEEHGYNCKSYGVLLQSDSNNANSSETNHNYDNGYQVLVEPEHLVSASVDSRHVTEDTLLSYGSGNRFSCSKDDNALDGAQRSCEDKLAHIKRDTIPRVPFPGDTVTADISLEEMNASTNDMAPSVYTTDAITIQYASTDPIYSQSDVALSLENSLIFSDISMRSFGEDTIDIVPASSCDGTFYSDESTTILRSIQTNTGLAHDDCSPRKLDWNSYLEKKIVNHFVNGLRNVGSSDFKCTANEQVPCVNAEFIAESQGSVGFESNIHEHATYDSLRCVTAVSDENILYSVGSSTVAGCEKGACLLPISLELPSTQVCTNLDVDNRNFFSNISTPCNNVNTPTIFSNNIHVVSQNTTTMACLTYCNTLGTDEGADFQMGGEDLLGVFPGHDGIKDGNSIIVSTNLSSSDIVETRGEPFALPRGEPFALPAAELLINRISASLSTSPMFCTKISTGAVSGFIPLEVVPTVAISGGLRSASPRNVLLPSSPVYAHTVKQTGPVPFNRGSQFISDNSSFRHRLSWARSNSFSPFPQPVSSPKFLKKPPKMPGMFEENGWLCKISPQKELVICKQLENSVSIIQVRPSMVCKSIVVQV